VWASMSSLDRQRRGLRCSPFSTGASVTAAVLERSLSRECSENGSAANRTLDAVCALRRWTLRLSFEATNSTDLARQRFALLERITLVGWSRELLARVERAVSESPVLAAAEIRSTPVPLLTAEFLAE